ncbi:MAG: DNA-(apurinic or apyrimidinic site) lyase [Bacteroidetes bacterium]|nr:MAG: DNA-(apurinic or apyrimidinic site) lyase [Bacteroidota bacterium]
MPELPEVHAFQQYFNGIALGRKVQRVVVHDDKIIRNMNGQDFAERVAQRTFTGSIRRGKYLFVQLDNGHDLLLHFGMTGDLRLYDEQEEPHRFERFAFVFTNGQRLGFLDARKFARILYLEDRAGYIKEVGLGPDALAITEDEFLKACQGRTTTIKGLLLNQKILAGVGNLYADEVCYRTRVHPASHVNAIPKKKLQEIFHCLQDILKQAVDKAPYYKEYPENWFWEVWRHEGHVPPNGRGVVERAKVAGRTTYFAKSWQRLY